MSLRLTIKLINSFAASGDFCHLLITCANILDQGQDKQNIGPDLDKNSLMVTPERFYFVNILKKTAINKKHEKIIQIALSSNSYLHFGVTQGAKVWYL